MKKSNKKKYVAAGLAIAALAGAASYGAYSWYWSRTNNLKVKSAIDVASFDPQVDGSFIYRSSAMELNCDYEDNDLTLDTGNGSHYAADGIHTIICEGESTIKNNGGTPITLSGSFTSPSFYSNYYSLTSAEGTLGETELDVGETTTYKITIVLTGSSGIDATYQDEGYFVTDPVIGDAFTIEAPYSLTAKQKLD